MSSSPIPNSSRRLIHRRAIDVQVFARDDELFEVEAGLVDSKTQDIPLADGIRRAGDPIHDMTLSLVIDRQMTIRQASSVTRWMPYPGACESHGDAYAKLVGLNLMRGFRLGVKDRLSGVKGCTHLTELCQVLPTAVIQAFAGTVIDTREGSPEGHPPFQIDRCHALRSDGSVVETHYPRWYRKMAEAAQAAEPRALPASSS
ncbi:DUF2889 domain-containing protein [Paucibacter sp. KCTC 42545]|uniref:DUF2889 domain-containing protein n=1 Tax=Paucibacter sp. KCTC 42545 TaxID=1768242 RepID=UPI000733C217|nr:DUF2889 domain-containing protein [Paucibacter sp. KCTC 42545]ALT78733.1 hypothetical protein AT984_17590 [Paucibacter sp. KCTC 42545]